MAPVAPPPLPLLTTLAPSAVLGELQLDLPNGWMPRAASVLATADGYRVVVPTDVGDERRTVVAHLDDALDVLTVTVADDHEPADEDRVQVPGGELRIVQSSHGAEGGSQFVLVDDGRRAAASPSFRIVAGTGEQRCSGLAEREGELVVSFALDGRLGLAVVETAEILALLHPDGTLTSSTSSEVP
jgi:hypothetical protein